MRMRKGTSQSSKSTSAGKNAVPVVRRTKVAVVSRQREEHEKPLNSVERDADFVETIVR